MNMFLKTAIASVALGATAFAGVSAANARDWHHRHHGSNDDAIVAGIAGLAAGALIGGALASPPSYYEPDYYEPDYYAPRYYEREYVVRRPVVVRRAPVRYYGGIEPWTRAWYEYCSDRYRSFNPRTGTFVGYDGEDHFCVAN